MGIPFGSRSSLTIAQRGGSHKTGEQMSPKERREYIDKLQGKMKLEREKKRKKKPVPKKGPGFQPKEHNKYYK